MSRNSATNVADRNERPDALEFLHNGLNWPEVTGPFSYEQTDTTLTLHCHLSTTIGRNGDVFAKVPAALRRLAQLLSDEADRASEELAAVESRRG
jgi:hypothetical protein